MRRAVGMLAMLATASAARADPPMLPAFAAHYEATWKSINVATSDLELKPDAAPGHFVYTWTIGARGVFRLVYHDEVVQTSWVGIDKGHARPGKYRGVEGSSSVSLEFDWENARVHGTSEGKPVDLALKPGMQDLMSIQLEVMLDLQTGELPRTFEIIEKDQPKEFNYTNEGKATLHTALGDLETIVVASQRSNNARILRMWFAPSLGYIPVQAERSRDGKLEFAMRIKTLKR